MNSRESKLLQLVTMLWNCIPPAAQPELRTYLDSQKMGWALPVDPCIPATGYQPVEDEWFTVDQIAARLGMTPRGVRNWCHRHGLKPVKRGFGQGRGREPDLYRWKDVEAIRDRVQRRNTPRAA